MFRKKLTTKLIAKFKNGEMEWLNPYHPLRAMITEIALHASMLTITTGRTILVEPEVTLECNRFKLNSIQENGETLCFIVSKVCAVESHRVELLVNRNERLILMDAECPLRIFPRIESFREAA